MTEYINELLDSTYTKDNLHRKIMLLQEFYDNYYFKENLDGNLKDRLKNFLIDESIGEYLRSSLLTLSNDFYSSFRADNFRKILSQIEDEQSNRPHIIIYVPTILPPIEIEKLGKWARDNVASDIFIDLKVDVATIGGCSFVWDGVHHDYSLKYYLENKKTEIRTLLSKNDG